MTYGSDEVTVQLLQEVDEEFGRQLREDLARELVGAGPNIKVAWTIRITGDVPQTVPLGQRTLELPAKVMAFIVSGQYRQYCAAVMVRRSGRHKKDAERLFAKCKRTVAGNLRGSDGSLPGV